MNFRATDALALTVAEKALAWQQGTRPRMLTLRKIICLINENRQLNAGGFVLTGCRRINHFRLFEHYYKSDPHYIDVTYHNNFSLLAAPERRRGSNPYGAA